MRKLIPPEGPKYHRLRDFLRNLPSSAAQLELHFGQVIGIIFNELPKFAYLHRAWWANDSKHVQGAAWLAAGWETSDVKLEERRILFIRNR